MQKRPISILYIIEKPSSQSKSPIGIAEKHHNTTLNKTRPEHDIKQDQQTRHPEMPPFELGIYNHLSHDKLEISYLFCNTVTNAYVRRVNCY
jgi:hypothetical protein